MGCKFHPEVIDGGIPVSGVLTSTSVHDSQVAIPLATLTAGVVRSLYDVMDRAYDAKEIKARREQLGHVPLIAVNLRRDKELQAERQREALALRSIGQVLPERVLYRSGSRWSGSTGGSRTSSGGGT